MLFLQTTLLNSYQFFAFIKAFDFSIFKKWWNSNKKIYQRRAFWC